MKLKFADSFWQSLKNLDRRGTWWYKTYHLIRYEVPHFFNNIWKFRKELWEYHWWDHTYLFMLMRKSLVDMATNIERYGYEVDKTRIKKVDKMLRAAKILDNIIEHRYTEIAEEQLGKELKLDWDITDDDQIVFTTSKKQEKINKQIRTLADKIEEEEWKELWRIFEGQDYKEYHKIMKRMNPVERMEKDIWGDWYDGSGAKNWWD